MATFINQKPDAMGRIENTKILSVNTNLGYVAFHCNTGNKYEAINQLKADFGVTSADYHHARYVQ